MLHKRRKITFCFGCIQFDVPVGLPKRNIKGGNF